MKKISQGIVIFDNVIAIFYAVFDVHMFLSFQNDIQAPIRLNIWIYCRLHITDADFVYADAAAVVDDATAAAISAAAAIDTAAAEIGFTLPPPLPSSLQLLLGENIYYFVFFK